MTLFIISCEAEKACFKLAMIKINIYHTTGKKQSFLYFFLRRLYYKTIVLWRGNQQVSGKTCMKKSSAEVFKPWFNKNVIFLDFKNVCQLSKVWSFLRLFFSFKYFCSYQILHSKFYSISLKKSPWLYEL